MPAPRFSATRSVVQISGVRELSRRLLAAADPDTRRRGMAQLGLLAVRFSKEEAPKRTRTLERRIRLRSSSATNAVVAAETDYARAVHDGARPHTIVPRVAKVLAWPTGATRLTGTARSGTGKMAFARRVKHPGNKPNRFLTRGLQRAAREGGRELLEAVIRAWNGAA